MGAKELHAELQRRFPGQSNAQIGRLIGAGNGVISKLGRGIGIGLKQAEWLARDDADKIPMLKEAEEATRVHIKNTHIKINRQRAIKPDVDLSALPRHIQLWAGYVS